MASHQERFSELSKMKYADQAIWFLNAYWNELQNKEALKIWTYVEKFVELDKMSDAKKGPDGNELDVFWSAKFLESFDETLTATKRKEALRQIDQDNNGHMSTIEYLVWRFKKGIPETVDAPQGTSDELVAAQQALKKVEAALEKVRQALAQLAKLEAELKKAIAELEKEEATYKSKCDTLQQKIDNPSTSGMQRSKASNELAQLKAEDPLPLRRAKITQEAALRKVERQKKQVQKEENALLEELATAQVAVDKAAAKGGDNAPGLLWWMRRQLFEADARLPQAKQKFNHSKPFAYDPLTEG